MSEPTSGALPERIEPDPDADESGAIADDAGIDPLGALGGLDLGSLMGAAQEMMGQMAEAQEALAAQVVEGSSGGGLVRIVSSGDGQFTAVHIDPAAADPDDPTLLEDLVLAALHDSAAQVSALQASASPLGGGALGGLLG